MTGIAILGAGIFAKEAHLPALAKIAEESSAAFELKAVYSRSQASAESLAAAAQKALSLSTPPAVYYDVAEGGAAADAATALKALFARDDVAGLVLVLPITLQPGIIREALAAGKHILSEKPVAPDVKSGAKLIAHYRAEYAPKGVIWRVAENFEAEESLRVAAQWIREEKIGTVEQFNVRVVNSVDKDSRWYKTPWRTVPDYQGGFLLDGGVHTAAALRVILGGPLSSLSGHASLAKDFLAPHDTITASLLASNGAHGTFHMTFGAPHPAADAAMGGTAITVLGSHGWVSQKPVQVDGKDVSQVVLRRVKVDGKGEEEEISRDFDNRGVQVELESWLNAIANKNDGLGFGDPRNALQDVALIEAALKSNGRSVDLTKLVATGEIV